MASEIYKNVSEDNIEYEGLTSHYHDEDEEEDFEEEEIPVDSKTQQIFDIKSSRRAEKQKLRLEKKRMKEESKHKTNSFDDEPKSTTAFPSWLKK